MHGEYTIEKLKRGDKGAFEKFYYEFYPLFLSFARRFIPDDEPCRDIVQDVLVHYWNHTGLFDELAAVKVYYYRSIRSRCLNWLSQRKVHEKYISDQLNRVSGEEFFLETIFREEVAYTVHLRIGQLPPAAQQVLFMSVDGLSNLQIAEALGISVNTVKTHKARAYAVLRSQLRELKTILAVLAGI